MTLFWVVCDDYRYPMTSREAAERQIASLQGNESACPLPHHIEEEPDGEPGNT